MRHLQKSCTAIALSAALIACTAPMIFADTETAAVGEEASLLSPAIRILAARTTMRKSGVLGEALCFSSADFERVLGYAPTAVKIETLPDRASGTLKLGTLDLQEGVTLSASTLQQLRFVPALDDVPVQAAFSFTAEGKAYTTDTALTCMVNVLSVKNEAPEAADMALTTYSEVPLYSALRASDMEGDSLTYTIVRAPKKGTVTVDAENGSFMYTPAQGKRGNDVFTYRVSDEWGNESDLCRVEVSIRRTDEDLQYSDLDGHWCTAAAMFLTEEGIMDGTTLGDAMLFSPDSTVTRGEFLVTAMRAAGYENLPAMDVSLFADNDSIPEQMSGYVRTAYENGIISGGISDMGTPTFSAGDTITRAEAAVIVHRLFSVETPAVLPVFSDTDIESLPAWSAGAFYAVRAAGIITAGEPNAVMDRAQMAQMLVSAMNYQ